MPFMFWVIAVISGVAVGPVLWLIVRWDQIGTRPIQVRRGTAQKATSKE